MLFKSVGTAALAAAAVAQPLHHQHQHPKRALVVKTVYHTEFRSITIAGPSSSEFSSLATAGPSSPEYIPEDSPEDNSEDTSNKTPDYSPDDSDDEIDDDDSTGSSSGLLGITYSPYTTGDCKSRGQVASEISKLSNYRVIRIYGSDCNQVDNVLSALAPHQKVFLGVDNPHTVETDIKALISGVAGRWGRVHTVAVGNEWVNSNQVPAGQITGLVESARSILNAHGYTGPVVNVDTFIAILNNRELQGVGDYTCANGHSFYDPTITAANAGDWVKKTYLQLVQTCGRKTLISESGWPSKGLANGLAQPGHQQQQVAIKSIADACGDKVIFFSAFDELWKQDTPYTFGAEKYWGIHENLLAN